MCALVEFIRHFKPYLYGSEFMCRVDHFALIWLKSMKNLTGILARWQETLEEYSFKRYTSTYMVMLTDCPDFNTLCKPQITILY